MIWDFIAARGSNPLESLTHLMCEGSLDQVRQIANPTTVQVLFLHTKALRANSSEPAPYISETCVAVLKACSMRAQCVERPQDRTTTRRAARGKALKPR